MKRVETLTALALAIVSLALLSTGVPGEAEARAGEPTGMVVFVADGEAIRLSDPGAALTRSLVGLVATLREGRLLTLIAADDPSRKLGPFEIGATGFDAIQDEIESTLSSSLGSSGGGIGGALAAAYELMVAEEAAFGSSVYVITGSSSRSDFEALTRQMPPLAARFEAQAWPINGIVLPGGPSSIALDFLSSMSDATNGRTLVLDVASGFAQLAEDVLGLGTIGSLDPVGRRELSPNEVLSSAVSISPGTREATLLFFKQSPYGSLRMSNPAGFDVSAGDRKESFVIETPHVVIWKLIDPAPGNWKIEARGMEGLVSVWQHVTNKYSLVLSARAPLALDRPSTPLAAYVSDGTGAVVLSDVKVFARVSIPDGGSVAYEMKDDGLQSDAKSGDGLFSVTLPPLTIEGTYQVELELSWADYNHRISSSAHFDVEAYPSLEVKTERLEGLEPGQRVMVASAYVHVRGQPYPVPADQVTATLTSPAGEEALIEMQPRRMFGDGPAWEYEVYVTPRTEGLHTLLLRLNVEYAGRAYSQNSGSIVVSSILPAVKVDAPAPPPVAVAPAAVVKPAVPLPAPARRATPAQFPWRLVGLAVAVLAALGAAAVYFITRSRPYGFLYDDEDEPLVDFSSVKRNPVSGFLFKGLVSGRDLGVPGFEDVVFRFSGKQASVRNVGDEPSVRVNNQPLVGQVDLHDRTWIGARGKLYTFMLSPAPMEEEVVGNLLPPLPRIHRRRASG